MIDEDLIELERRVAAPPAVVFRHLTDASLWVRWQGVAAEIEPRPGGRFRVAMPGGPTAEGAFVAVEPDRRVVFTWGWDGDPTMPPGHSTVEIVLVPDGDGTIVRLVHSGIPRESVPIHRVGWDRYLPRLVEASEGRTPPPDQAGPP
jgi:uncharacterized protein YndB with AHSA1/START domain